MDPEATPVARRLPPAQRREQIIEAAREVFRELPFAGTPVRLIAERAGITEALFYRYFGSKQSIYSHAVLEPFDEYVEALTSDTHDLAARSDISREEILEHFHQLALARIADVAPLMGAVLFSEDGTRFYTDLVYPKLHECMRRMVSDLSDIDSLDLDLATQVMMGIYFAVILEDLLAGEQHDPVDAGRQLAMLFAPGLTGRQPPTSALPICPGRHAAFSADPEPEAWPRNQVPRSVRRELVLTAARSVFLEKGPSTAKGSEIAHRAGITEAFLYRLFDSKDEIYTEAVERPLERGFAELADHVYDLGQLHTGLDFIQALNEIGVAFFLRFSGLCVVALFSDLPEGQRFYREQVIPHLARIRTDIERHTALGDLPIDPELARRTLIGAQWAVSFNITAKHEPADITSLARTLTGLLAGGVTPADPRRRSAGLG